MFLTIQTLFDDANIVSAIIRRVNQTRKDTIYWQQYLTFRRVTTRVFKDYIGSVTGVMVRLPIWVMLIRCLLTVFPNYRI